MNDEILEQLQTKIAFLERANADLSDVLFRQQQEIRGGWGRAFERWRNASRRHNPENASDHRKTSGRLIIDESVAPNDPGSG